MAAVTLGSARKALLSCAGVCALASTPAFAQDTEAAKSTVFSVEVSGSAEVGPTTVSIEMPCASPEPGPPTEGVESAICPSGNKLFAMLTATNENDEPVGPFETDFDALVADLEADSDTVSLEITTFAGRRALYADQQGVFGFLRAVELNEDTIVYAFSLTDSPNGEGPSEADESEMRAFLETLEIVE